MKNKGFTLIETIIVIAILAILAVFFVPNVFGLIQENKIRQCKTLKTQVETATDIYISDNRYTVVDKYNIDCQANTTNVFAVSLETLTTENYLTTTVINPLTEEDLTPKSVEVTFNCTTRKYSYKFDLDCE